MYHTGSVHSKDMSYFLHSDYSPFFPSQPQLNMAGGVDPIYGNQYGGQYDEQYSGQYGGPYGNQYCGQYGCCIASV